MPKRGKRPFNDDGAAAKSPAGTASLGDTASQDAKSSAGIASHGTAAAKDAPVVEKEASRVAIQAAVASRKSREGLSASGLLGTGRGGAVGVGGATGVGLPSIERMVEHMRIIEGKFEVESALTSCTVARRFVSP